MNAKSVVCGSISRPLLNTKQLLNWRDFIGNDRNYSVPNKAFLKKDTLSHETLICHDMKGGYIEDSFNDGQENIDTYRFYHWSLIDIFIYFSHHFVTIPPIGWISAAHRNGVSCFGTLIVEDWSKIQPEQSDKPVSGRDILLEIIKNEESIELYAQNLTEIAKHFNFDGWLVNIEVAVSSNKVPYLLKFVRLLTDKMHKMLKTNYDDENKLYQNPAVIWYDSVSTSGSIDYQNALTEKNLEFFKSSDGIFLNYWWEPELLKKSVDLLNKHSIEKKKRFRIYAGIDVHGRNTYGGGKWNTHLALRAIQEQQVSTAIFAPAWTFENFFKNSDFSFEDIENKFWSQNYPFLTNSEKKIENLPISTNFCHGTGKSGRFNFGKNIEKTFEERLNWFDLSEMQLQPSFCFNKKYCLENSFNGISCLELSPKVGKEFILFRTKINFFSKNFYQLTLAYIYPESFIKFIQFNQTFLKELKNLKISQKQNSIEKFENLWKKEELIFEIEDKNKSEEDVFVLESISIKLPEIEKTEENFVCFVGLLELKQI